MATRSRRIRRVLRAFKPKRRTRVARANRRTFIAVLALVLVVIVGGVAAYFAHANETDQLKLAQQYGLNIPAGAHEKSVESTLTSQPGGAELQTLKIGYTGTNATVTEQVVYGVASNGALIYRPTGTDSPTFINASKTASYVAYPLLNKGWLVSIVKGKVSVTPLSSISTRPSKGKAPKGGTVTPSQPSANVVLTGTAGFGPEPEIAITGWLPTNGGQVQALIFTQGGTGMPASFGNATLFSVAHAKGSSVWNVTYANGGQFTVNLTGVYHDPQFTDDYYPAVGPYVCHTASWSTLSGAFGQQQLLNVDHATQLSTSYGAQGTEVDFYGTNSLPVGMGFTQVGPNAEPWGTVTLFGVHASPTIKMGFDNSGQPTGRKPAKVAC